MIKIEKLTVIKKEESYIAYFQSLHGTKCLNLLNSTALKILDIFEKKYHSLTGNILAGSGISIDHVYLIKEANEIISYLEINKKRYQASLEEILPLALEMGVVIFIDEELLEQDYQFSDEHEAEVQILINQEIKSVNQYRMQTLLNAISEAVSEEKYEVAADLRDEILSYKNDKLNQ